MLVEDLIYEATFDAPIIQLLSGKFLPGAPDNIGIAVLHPRKLVVYELLPQGPCGLHSRTSHLYFVWRIVVSSTTNRVTHYTFSKVYQHSLGDSDGKHFTAAAMMSGMYTAYRIVVIHIVNRIFRWRKSRTRNDCGSIYGWEDASV